MRRVWVALLFLVIALVSIREINAQVTVVQRAGPQTSGYVIDFQGQTLGVKWTQTSAFIGVSIFATLEFGPAQGFAYLTTKTGPGTTMADQVAGAAFLFPATTVETPLFAGLSLGPGTYYLTLTNTNGGSAAWWGTNAQTVSAAPGVTLSPDYDTFTPAPYPPATSFFTPTSTNLLFRVTGIPVPEPFTPVMLVIGVGMVMLCGFRRRVQA